MMNAPSSSAALARNDVTRNVEGIRLPEAPEKIADWRRAPLGNRGNAEQEDDEGAYRAAFKDHIGKNQMGVATRDIRPYAVTVYEPEGLIIDRVITALQGQSKANGGVLLYSHNASAENLAHFMKSKVVLNERDLVVRDIEKTEATSIPRNSEVDYYVGYKNMLEDVISPLAFEKRRLLNLVPGERYMRRCKPGIMIKLSGARKAEMGFDPKPTGHGYPERAYELIAQTIAEIVSKGYPGMPITKEERANAKVQPTLDETSEILLSRIQGRGDLMGEGESRRGGALRVYHPRQ